jgi:hypothetical protein
MGTRVSDEHAAYIFRAEEDPEDGESTWDYQDYCMVL